MAPTVTLLTILIIISTPANAALKSMGLAETLKKGLEYSPELKRASSQISEADDTITRTRGAIFPTIAATGSAITKQNSSTFTSGTGAGSSNSSGDTYAAALTLNQTLYSGGLLTNGLNVVKVNSDIARQTYYDVKQQSALAILKAFYNLSQAQQKLDTASQNRDILKSYVDITSRYERIGRSRRMDKLQAVVNYSLSLADVEQIQNDMRLAEANMKKLLGEQSSDLIIKADYITSITPIESISPETAYGAAHKNNPGIRINQLKEELVTYNKDVDLAVDFPSLNLIGSYGYQSPDRSSLFYDTSKSYSIGLSLTVPLFSGFSSFSKRNIYGERLYQAQRDLQLAENDLRSNLESTLQSLKSARTQLEIAQGSLKESRSALELANKGYQQGVASSTDVVNLQRTRYDSEKLFVTSQFSYLLELATLRQLMGIDLEKAYVK